MENDILVEVLKASRKKKSNTVKVVIDKSEYEALKARLLELSYTETLSSLIFRKVIRAGNKILLIELKD